MHNRFRSLALLALALLFLAACGGQSTAAGESATTLANQTAIDNAWTTRFQVQSGELSATGRNPYFILEPGYQQIFEGGRDRLVITVLDETKMVDGVETRVVEERETKDGELAEVSRNYFAISKRTGDVFYFGEEVDIYKSGVVTHEGAWLSGIKDAKFGLMMPGSPLVGARHYQEVAPGVALDRAEILSMSEALQTPAGEFKDILKVEETSPLEPGAKAHKYYGSGIGLVQEGSLKLVSFGKAK
jgi:hypothetical protein